MTTPFPAPLGPASNHLSGGLGICLNLLPLASKWIACAGEMAALAILCYFKNTVMSLPLLGSIQSRVSSGTVTFEPASAGSRHIDVDFDRPYRNPPAVVACRSNSLNAGGIVEVAVEAITQTGFQIHLSSLNPVGEISVSYIACG